MFKKLALAAVMATSFGAAQAAPLTIVNPDFPAGTAFTGFDWSSTGAAWIQGFGITSATPVGTSDMFTLQYQAYAANIQNNGVNLVTPGLRAGTGTGYEYTISLTLNEVATCIGGTATSCTAMRLDILGGTYTIYYQAAGNAAAGASGMSGMTDGTAVVQGTVVGSNAPVFSGVVPNMPGNVSLGFDLFGPVTVTNMSFITPDITGSNASGTLQFGTATTSWVRPTKWNGVALPANSSTTFVMQADGNQAFSVPEPGALALVGLALAGFGAARRQRRA